MVGMDANSAYQVLDFNSGTLGSKIDRAKGMLDRLSASKDGDNLAKAAAEFEAYFLYFVLKAMRATIERSDLFGDSRTADMYQSMLDEKLAQQAASGSGLGLSGMLLNKGLPGWTNREQPEGGANRAPDRRHDHSVGPAPYGLKGVVSSPFGYRNDPFTGEKRFHWGVDVAMAEGSTIGAVAAGRVAFSGSKPGSGNMVVVESEDGHLISYSHNKKNLVSPGDRVRKGQPVALAGSTGRSTGPHLHLEVVKDGKRVDPSKYISLMI